MMQGGVELKNIIYDPGENHTKVSGDIVVNGSKIGEVIDDGWCDELYIEFINEDSEKLFIKIRDRYCRKNDIVNFNIDAFFRDLIYKDRIKVLKSQGRKKLKGLKQLDMLKTK